MSRVAVIGAGLFGSIIGDWLKLQGHAVTWYDDQRAFAGSQPAACLMKPSWAGNMSKQEYDDAQDLLVRLYPCHVATLEFDLPLGQLMPVDWVDPAEVLKPKAQPHKIIDLVPGTSGHPWLVYEGNGGCWAFDHVIVATGSWVNELLSGLPVQTEVIGGWGWLFAADRPEVRRIKPWAPYKQLVGFQRGPGQFWIGDGTALKPSSMTEDARQRSLSRCQEFAESLGVHVSPVGVAGYRPKVKGLKAPAYVNQVELGLWVATGGAKNGTLGAAWAARQIAEKLC